MSYNYQNEFFNAVKNTKNLGFDLKVESFSNQEYFQ